MHTINYIQTEDRIRIRYGFSLSEIKPVRGTILFLNGRSEFLEKHRETIGELSGRGYNVFSFDWRGQGLSSRLIGHPHKGYVRDYADYVRDMNRIVHEIVLPSAVRPLTILSHSMGGHIAIRYLHDYPKIFDRAIFLSPMTGIRTFPYPLWFARMLAKLASRFGFGENYAIGCGDNRASCRRSFENNKLTSDFRRFTDERFEIEKNPNLALGGVSYQWLSATFDSTDLIFQPEYIEKIAIPVLIISASDDKVVCTRSQARLCTRMADCRMIYISGSRHEILKECNEIRQKFWNIFERFMADPDAFRLTFGQKM